ncbi:MAG: hypothetical protein ACI90V_006783, partial [Bacillariaceae sp.]
DLCMYFIYIYMPYKYYVGRHREAYLFSFKSDGRLKIKNPMVFVFD